MGSINWRIIVPVGFLLVFGLLIFFLFRESSNPAIEPNSPGRPSEEHIAVLRERIVGRIDEMIASCEKMSPGDFSQEYIDKDLPGDLGQVYSKDSHEECIKISRARKNGPPKVERTITFKNFKPLAAILVYGISGYENRYHIKEDGAGRLLISPLFVSAPPPQ